MKKENKMKPYGHKNYSRYSYPDIADGLIFAYKASMLNLPGKGGILDLNLKTLKTKDELAALLKNEPAWKLKQK